MKGAFMKILGLYLLLLLLLPSAVYSAEPEGGRAEMLEPTLFDHYHSLKRMQESLSGRSLEEQGRMQSQIQRAERKACDRLRKERSEGVPKEDYRSQGGDEFLVFSHQLEQYCNTLR